MTPEVSQEQITVSESECYEITHIREKSGFAAGVLVAISVPIFTAQLKKARIATNQANARSAKAAAVTSYMEDSANNLGGTYTVSSGQFVPAKAPTSGGVTGFSTDITTWATATEAVYSDTTYATWIVKLDADGAVTEYSATK